MKTQALLKSSNLPNRRGARASCPHAGGTPAFQGVERGRGLGFTLIELLITIVIVGILASVAIPAYSGFVANQRIKTASFDIISSLSMTRSEALKRNTAVIVTAAGGGWQNGWKVTAGGTTLNEQAPLPGVTITCKTGGATVLCPANVTYSNNGRLLAAVASFELSNTSSTSKRCIAIHFSGRPNSKVGAC